MYQRQGLAGNAARALLEDALGRLWIGTNQGVSLHADGKLIAVHDELRAQFPFIAKDIHEGANGTIWIAADTGLLALSDHGVRKYTVADGLPATVVVEIYPDGDDALWVGTAGGLARVVDGRVTSLAAGGGVLRQSRKDSQAICSSQ